MNLFYIPNIETNGILPEEEAAHAVRVLRLKEGDTLFATDGKGNMYTTKIVSATNKQCVVSVESKTEGEKVCNANVHIAVAPTKNMDRNEWFAEKATEIGINKISYLNCRFSERKVIKTERIEKIVVSAMKQSLKAYKPVVEEMIDFDKFIAQDFGNVRKFIAHCHNTEKAELKDVVTKGQDTLVMIGAEGDFSEEEVAKAVSMGFEPVSLGRARLRTETAALVACHTINIINQ